MSGVVHQPRTLLGQLGRTVTTSVFARQRQYITLKHIGDAGPTPPIAPDGRTECLVVDSPEVLDTMAADICASFRDSVGELRARVARGCVVCVARRPRTDGRRGSIVVGYEIAEPGIFSALGRRVAVPKDVIFSHYVEVLPAYRGQRIHRLLFATRDAYFRARGGRVVCGVCAPHNRASLRALDRDGAAIVGIVQRVSLLRVFVLWYTPFDRIAQLLG